MMELNRELPNGLFRELKAFVKAAKPKLWGSVQPKSFFESMLIITLARDVLGMSYCRIKREIKFDQPLGNTSIQHNIKGIRSILRLWAEGLIFLGSKDDWEASIDGVNFPKWMRSVRFWMDSSDFRIWKRKGRGKKSIYWSGKEGAPGWRFMTLSDGRNVIRQIWGGYSPKVYDGHFIDVIKGQLNDTIPGTGILADSHFHLARAAIPKVTIFAPKPEQTAINPETQEEYSKLTKEEQKRNGEIRAKRARVEQLYSSIKSQMGSLKLPWTEDLKQLDNVVYFSAGVHNWKKQRTQ
jgi:hypothetical protein